MEDDDELLQIGNWSGPSLPTGSPSCSTPETADNTPPPPSTQFSTSRSLSMTFPSSSHMPHSSYSSSNTAPTAGIFMDSALHMMGFVDHPQWWTQVRDDRCFSSSLDAGADSPSPQTRNGFSSEYMDFEFTHDAPYACSTSLFHNIMEVDDRMKQPLFENNRSLDNPAMASSSLQTHSYWDLSPLELRPPWSPHTTGDIHLQSAAVLKKNGSEGSVKRSRAEAPSPLPNLKARKEKLGDRITALQQLVSPFGKTDTASVLHEAIEKIRFLHDQVNALSMPYMKSGVPYQFRKSQSHAAEERGKESEMLKEDLRSHGLCLVPVSLTSPAVSSNESTVDFWTPAFGGTLKWGSHHHQR